MAKKKKPSRKAKAASRRTSRKRAAPNIGSLLRRLRETNFVSVETILRHEAREKALLDEIIRE